MPTDVILFSLFRTDAPYSSISLSMAKELVRSVRVIYVNHPYSWKDIISGLAKGDPMLRKRVLSLLLFQNAYETLLEAPGLVVVTPPPTLPINWLPPGRLYRFFQQFNNRFIRSAIQRAARKHNFKHFLFINCYDPFFAGHLPKETGAFCSIYHCIDDISQDPYTARHGLALENEACQQADITLVTSRNLGQLKQPFARRLEYYYNAADVTVFNKVLSEKYPLPDVLKGCSGQVIGFVGNLDALRIDYPLLKKVALQFPEKTLLLVGPLNSREPEHIGLTQLPNVVFAGSKKLEELPPLVQYMDVALIPFLCNTLTYSIYPLKINEYLAAGKPVVSTSFSEDIRSFAEHCYLAEDHDSFLQQIEQALHENNPAIGERRAAVAESNSWQARIRQLWTLIRNEEGN